MVQYKPVKALATLLLLPIAAVAARVEFAQQGMPEFADTEVSTNVAIVADSDRMCEIAVRFAVGSASNCLQVAFGRDADGDGILGLDETETLYGWRNGRYFAETFTGLERIEEPAPGAASCDFTVRLQLRKSDGFRRFSAYTASGAAVLTNLTASTHPWLYSPDWNVMRITRRGPGLPSEWLRCETKPHFMRLIVR